MPTKTSEERLQLLEDLEEIRSLTIRYAHHINKGWNGKVVDVGKMPTIFTKDAEWESPDMKIMVSGLDNIMSRLPDDTADVDFSMHTVLNPVIEVSGDTATGNWLMWVAVKRKSGARHVYLSLDNIYSRTSDGWRIRKVQLHVGASMDG